MKLSLLESHITVPRQNPKSQCLLKLVGEGRPPGFVKYNATPESELAKFFLQLAPLKNSWTRASGTNVAGATAVVKSVGEFRPLGIANFSASTESEFAKVF